MAKNTGPTASFADRQREARRAIRVQLLPGFCRITAKRCAVRITRTALLSDQFGHLVWPGFAPCAFSQVNTANCRIFAD